MRNIAFLIKETHMSYEEVMDLPYAVFLSLLKHFRIFQLEQTPEGQKLLLKSSIINQTEPDLARIRSEKGYKAVNKE